MRFHPDVLRCHEQFGGDLEDMQRRYDAADKATSTTQPTTTTGVTEALIAAAAVTVEKLIGHGWRGPVYAKRPNANACLLTRAADALAAKDAALSEMADRVHYAEGTADANIARADEAEAALSEMREELERARKALDRIETIAKDRSEKAWFRLDNIADEAHYAARALASQDEGEER